MAEKQAPVNFTSGVFDRPRQARMEPRKAQAPNTPQAEPATLTAEPLEAPKEFLDPFEQQRQSSSEMASRLKGAASAGPIDEVAINRLNKAMEMNAGLTMAVDDEKILPEEMDLAEQLIFKGYAEINVAMNAFPTKKFTICSTNAEEMSMIDEILYDMIKGAKSDTDDSVGIPESHVMTMRNAVFVAISYRGVDGKDIAPELQYSLNAIKKAIYHVSELFGDGKLDEATKLKESLKKVILKRAALVKRLPTTLIDFISGEKLRFDNKMSRIMSMKTIVPKS